MQYHFKRSSRRRTLAAIFGLTLTMMTAFALMPNAKADGPPYPPSPVITDLTWAPADTIGRAAHDSDNFPMTWADDDQLYTAYGDGYGFEPNVPEKLSLGLARVSGSAENFQGENIRSATGEQEYGGGSNGKKASGMLMVEGVLFMWVRNANHDGKECQLAWSADHAQHWQWSDWTFPEFGYCSFINYGKNYANARDNYVYMVSHDHPSAYDPGDGFILARVPKEQILDRNAYEFFVRLDETNQPVWTTDVDERGLVFEHENNARRSSITYNAALGRYLWWQGLPNGGNERFSGGFGVYDAPEPWGPWTTVYYTEDWDVGPGETGTFPSKWMSDDGQTIYLVFSGDDYFSVRKATLTVTDSREPGDTIPQQPPVDITAIYREAGSAVTHGSDDAEEKPDGTIDLYSDDLDLTLNGSDAQTVGVRFQRVQIPQGARIREAYIEFTPQGDTSGEASLIFRGQASGNARAFDNDDHNISQRAQTDASVQWDNIPSWEPGGHYQTPDLGPIVQEIVNRTDWQSGQAMAFIITGEGKRTAESYNSQPDAAPRLHVVYTRDLFLPIGIR